LGLVHQFDPVCAIACTKKCRDVKGPALSLGIENRISAAHICEHKMIGSTLVAQVHSVGLARMPAISVIIAVGQEAAKDTVLRVKNGQVLVDNNFKRP
jgi:hypothetical protein